MLSRKIHAAGSRKKVKTNIKLKEKQGFEHSKATFWVKELKIKWRKQVNN